MITTSQSAGKLIEIFATRSILTSVSRLLFNNVLQGNPWGKKTHYFWFIFWSWYLKMISGHAKQNQALSAMMKTSEFAWMFRWPMWQSSTEPRHQVSVVAHVFRSATWFRKSRVSQEHFLNVSPSQEENVQLLKERKLDLHVTRSIWRQGSSWSLNVLDSWNTDGRFSHPTNHRHKNNSKSEWRFVFRFRWPRVSHVQQKFVYPCPEPLVNLSQDNNQHRVSDDMQFYQSYITNLRVQLVEN